MKDANSELCADGKISNHILPDWLKFWIASQIWLEKSKLQNHKYFVYRMFSSDAHAYIDLIWDEVTRSPLEIPVDQCVGPNVPSMLAASISAEE